VRIEALTLERSPSLVRASARVLWEDSAREPLVLRFEADAHGAADLDATPEAFLAACALPAMRAGEKRVAIEGAVCPRLASGIGRSVALLRDWLGAPRRDVAIEPSEGFRPPRRRVAERTAMFFTGGVDSRHMLLTHRRAHAHGRPGAIEDGLSTFGHLCPSIDATRAWNARVVPRLAEAAGERGLTFAAVRTNVWELAPDVEFVAEESLSSALAASAHLFASRFTRIFKASSREAPRVIRSRLQAQMDPLFSSDAVEIVHSSSRYTRFERLAAAAAEPPGIEDLVVCLAFPGAGRLNCGECEKCVRTMTALIALGRLGEARLFPGDVFSLDAVRRVPIGPHDVGYWAEVLPALEARGRRDLAGVIREKLVEARPHAEWHFHEGWKGRLRRFDRRYLEGRLLELSRRFRRSVYPGGGGGGGGGAGQGEPA
jgi:hypothetical protein